MMYGYSSNSSLAAPILPGEYRIDRNKSWMRIAVAHVL